MVNKNVSLLIAYALFVGFSNQLSAGISEIEKLDLKDNEQAYLLKDGETEIEDNLIRRISVGLNEVTASYRNLGDQSRRPKYAIRLYNSYGLLLGEDSIGEGIFSGSYVDPGEVATDELNIEWFPLDRIFEKGNINLPENWKEVKWVVIAGSNTKILKDKKE